MRKKGLRILAALGLALVMGLASCGTTEPTKQKEYNEGMVYDSYNVDTYSYPYWRGNTVYNETCMFVGKTDASPLMYRATGILKVTSYDLQTVYTEGKDYVYDAKNNLLRRTEDSAMPYVEQDDWYLTSARANELGLGLNFPLKTPKPNGAAYLRFQEGPTISNMHVVVTYTHDEYAPDEWELPAVHTDKFTRLTQKLNNKEHVKLAFLGDSVTFGAIASGMPGASFAPNAEIYAQMITSFIRKHFGYENPADVEYYNPSVGGKTSSWGLDIAENDPEMRDLDFCVVAFGLNDSALGTGAVSFAINIGSIVLSLQKHNPDIEILAVSPMLGNPESTVYGDNDDFERGLYNELYVREEGDDDVPDYGKTGLAEVTKMHRQMYRKKGNRYCDITANNINHPNDFAERIYTMTCLTAMFGHDYFTIDNN